MRSRRRGRRHTAVSSSIKGWLTTGESPLRADPTPAQPCES
jgi:hypothetical protein